MTDDGSALRMHLYTQGDSHIDLGAVTGDPPSEICLEISDKDDDCTLTHLTVREARILLGFLQAILNS